MANFFNSVDIVSPIGPREAFFWRAYQRHTPVLQVQTWRKDQIRRRLQLVPVGLQDGHVPDWVSRFVYTLCLISK